LRESISVSTEQAYTSQEDRKKLIMGQAYFIVMLRDFRTPNRFMAWP